MVGNNKIQEEERGEGWFSSVTLRWADVCVCIYMGGGGSQLTEDSPEDLVAPPSPSTVLGIKPRPLGF